MTGGAAGFLEGSRDTFLSGTTSLGGSGTSKRSVRLCLRVMKTNRMEYFQEQKTDRRKPQVRDGYLWQVGLHAF